MSPRWGGRDEEGEEKNPIYMQTRIVVKLVCALCLSSEGLSLSLSICIMYKDSNNKEKSQVLLSSSFPRVTLLTGVKVKVQSGFLYVHVFMYVCVYVCVYVCMYVCMYRYVCRYVCTYICMYICMYV